MRVRLVVLPQVAINLLCNLLCSTVHGKIAQYVYVYTESGSRTLEMTRRRLEFKADGVVVEAAKVKNLRRCRQLQIQWLADAVRTDS